MSFLGGVDLGSPADRNRQALTNELESRRNRWTRAGYAYRGSGDLLLRHGQFYPGRELPDAYESLRGPPNHCFTNALEACEADPSLRYCEGVYCTGYGHPRAHGWCLDAEGGVVEVTMPTRGEELERYMNELHMPYLPAPRWGYFGAIFHPELVRAHGEQLGLPMLDRSSADAATGAARGLDTSEPHDFPILKVPYNPDRRTAP